MYKYFSKINQVFVCANKITPIYNKKYFSVLKRILKLRTDKGFSLKDMLCLGLLELDFDENDISKFISKREMLVIQKSINPNSWTGLTEDKGLFYKYCEALCIPIPKIFGIYFNNYPGCSYNFKVIKSKEQWLSFFDEIPATEFVIKPTDGVYGKGIYLFQKDGVFLKNIATSEIYSREDIYTTLSSSKNNFIIQERLKNHLDLVRLSNNVGLQTFRVWTYVDDNCEPQILYALLKVIVGKSIIDNHSYGLTGNLLAEVDLLEGTLMPAVKMDLDRHGIITFSEHPETGIVFNGYSVPKWNDVTSLAKKIALNFLPLRLIGWDIALTTSGPVVIEGNCFADPINNSGKMDKIFEKVRKDMSEKVN